MAGIDSACLACGMCLMESFQEDFPPGLAWSMICPLWYLVLCAFARIGGVELTGVLSLWKGVPLVLLGYFAGFAFLGPFTMLPFGLFCAAASIRFLKLSGGLAPGTRMAGHGIGVVAALALVISGAWTFAAAGVPATAESVLQVEADSDACRVEFRKLRRAWPASRPAYREIVRRARDPETLRSAAHGLGALGILEEEVPGLIDALEEHQRAGRTREAEALERALGRMTGCIPEPGSGIRGWREAWRKETQAK